MQPADQLTSQGNHMVDMPLLASNLFQASRKIVCLNSNELSQFSLPMSRALETSGSTPCYLCSAPIGIAPRPICDASSAGRAIRLTIFATSLSFGLQVAIIALA